MDFQKCENRAEQLMTFIPWLSSKIRDDMTGSYLKAYIFIDGNLEAPLCRVLSPQEQWPLNEPLKRERHETTTADSFSFNNCFIIIPGIAEKGYGLIFLFYLTPIARENEWISSSFMQGGLF